MIEAPSFDPDYVQANAWGKEPDAGQRWPWVTWVRGMLRADIESAPTLEDIGIERKIMMRRIRLRLTGDQHQRLVYGLR